MAYIISRALYLIREKDLFSLTECTLNKIVSANKIVLVSSKFTRWIQGALCRMNLCSEYYRTSQGPLDEWENRSERPLKVHS